MVKTNGMACMECIRSGQSASMTEREMSHYHPWSQIGAYYQIVGGL